ncbi:hypothetical protein GCM10027046_30840 [Uliginosibacterium flavum]|uniref:Uncharacterized protein n=1 Tax=Uliginosibacterium flavum TaxID=1396831 RepID=A0ABV2TG62_9RHOO
MESYVFRTMCGAQGYFQVDGDDCYIYAANNYFLPIKSECKLSHWVAAKDDLNICFPETTHSDPMSKVASYFVWSVWSSGGDISPNIVEFSKARLESGVYSLRMNRGSYCLYEQYKRTSNSLIDEVRSFHNISEAMEQIFKVLEPVMENLTAYGHRVREVLTIACAEVEYLLLQFLKENNYEPKNRYTTKDFVRALPYLKLDVFEVVLEMHPLLGTFVPFKSWSDESPTKSIPWYDDYNAAKHDRGSNFCRASFGSLVSSVAAIHVLLEAQYGEEVFDCPMRSMYKSCFKTTKRPIWPVGDIAAPAFSPNGSVLWNRESGVFCAE